MKDNIKKEIIALKRKEEAFLKKERTEIALKEVIYEKVPEKLIGTLELAFTKAFKLVFLKGTGLIEKTFKKEDLDLEFEANDFILHKKTSKKAIKRMDKISGKSNLLNNSFATVSGFGMGLLGMGIPDIPVLVSIILKGVYQIALSYGFDYNNENEKIYILRLIRVALTAGEDRLKYNDELESMDYEGVTVDQEITKTAKVLSDELLVEKFVQGMFIVGIIGGFVNHSVYKKISKLASIKYKKRYLFMKLLDNN